MTVQNSLIHNKIALGEGENLDFKHEIKNAKKIAVAICAFANTKGGSLLIGVKDNGKIIGVDPQQETYMAEHALTFLSPSPKCNYIVHNINSKKILELQVEACFEPVVCNLEESKKRAFVRVNDDNCQVDWVWLEVRRLKRSKKKAYTRFTEPERTLFKYLKINNKITQSQFSKLAKINYRKAGQILVNLICLQVVKQVIGTFKPYFELYRDNEG